MYQPLFCFIGLILGCVPSVFKHANYVDNNGKNNKFLKYLFLIFTFLLVFIC